MNQNEPVAAQALPEREAFERWARGRWPKISLDTDPQGDYYNPDTFLRWDAWQARGRAMAQAERDRNSDDSETLAKISELFMGYREGLSGELLSRAEYLVEVEAKLEAAELRERRLAEGGITLNQAETAWQCHYCYQFGKRPSSIVHDKTCALAEAESTMTAEIWFDGHRYFLPRSEHTGENLRAFFGVKRGKDLFVESDEGDDILIKPDATPYFVDNRDKFYSVSQKINQS